MCKPRWFASMSPWVLMLAVLALGGATAQATYGTGSSSAATTQVITYGTLDNFDVINDTNGATHGFEIELEGISASDVVYTFGAPYQRYGDPVVLPTATGVIIRYAALYDPGAGWSATTPFTAPPYLPTQGHSCWTGGVADPAQYYASGCDHFGASLNASPTKTTYRWLVEGTTPGTLTAYGSNVPLPAPVWNVTPPAVPGAQPVAAAAVAPPPPAAGAEFGDALWAKVYVTELPEGLQASDLEHMVIDHPETDIVPNDPAEVEVEWVLLQASTGNDGEQEFGGGAEVGAGNDAVSRRLEFFEYAGAYDQETHEALCDNPIEPAQQTPERCGTPDDNGVAGVGILIGAQNFAINLLGEFPGVGNRPPTANLDSAGTDEDIVLTIPASDLLTNDTDPDPTDVLAIESVQDAVNGTVALASGEVVFTPAANFNGPAGFTYTVNDGNGGTATASVGVTVRPVNDPPVADAGPDQVVRMKATVMLDGRASEDVEVGHNLTYRWTLKTPKASKAVLSSAVSPSPTFVADKKGTYEVRLVVNDGELDSTPATVRIEATTGPKT